MAELRNKLANRNPKDGTKPLSIDEKMKAMKAEKTSNDAITDPTLAAALKKREQKNTPAAPAPANPANPAPANPAPARPRPTPNTAGTHSQTFLSDSPLAPKPAETAPAKPPAEPSKAHPPATSSNTTATTTAALTAGSKSVIVKPGLNRTAPPDASKDKDAKIQTKLAFSSTPPNKPGNREEITKSDSNATKEPNAGPQPQKSDDDTAKPKTETKPVETKPPDSKSVEPKPVETKPVETKPVETKPAETKAAETKPAEAAKPRCRAAFDYVAEAETELSFKENDIIIIRMKDESGWWQGELGEAIGWFPANFVEEIPAEAESSAKAETKTESTAGDTEEAELSVEDKLKEVASTAPRLVHYMMKELVTHSLVGSTQKGSRARKKTPHFEEQKQGCAGCCLGPCQQYQKSCPRTCNQNRSTWSPQT